MVDTVTTASEKASKKGSESDHVLERLEALAEQYDDECRPKPWLYFIASEEEAAQMLIAMAATIKHFAQAVGNAMDKRMMLDVSAKYRKAVLQHKALDEFRQMTEADQLEIYGITLRAQVILVS